MDNLTNEQKRQIAVDLLKTANPHELADILREALLEQEHLPEYPNLTDLNSGQKLLLQVWLLLYYEN